MRIKRFEGPNTEAVLEQVSREAGPDALILSTENSKNGVVVIAALGVGETKSVAAVVPQKRASRERGLENQSAPSVASAVLQRQSESVESSLDLIDEIKEKASQERRLRAASLAMSQGEPPKTKAKSAREMTPPRKALEMEGGEARGDVRRPRRSGASLLTRASQVESHLVRQGLIRKLATQVSSVLTEPHQDREAAVRALARLVRPRRETLGPSTIALVGPSGVGKTTTLAKMASRLVARGERDLALVTFDTYRVGAVDQLRGYADMLRVPLMVVESPDELGHILEEWSPKGDVLIDTPGQNPYDFDGIDHLHHSLVGSFDLEVFLVQSATTAPFELVECVRRYSILEPSALILTKIDEASKAGVLVNLPFVTGRPLAYVSNGPEVPHHLLDIDPERIARALLEPQPSRALSEVVDE